MDEMKIVPSEIITREIKSFDENIKVGDIVRVVMESKVSTYKKEILFGVVNSIGLYRVLMMIQLASNQREVDANQIVSISHMKTDTWQNKNNT